MKNMLGVVLLMFFSPATWAQDARDPISICERYLDPRLRSNCEQWVKDVDLEPYWAAACEKQFEERAFENCIKLFKGRQTNLKSVAACQEDLDDTARLNCLKGASHNVAQSNQSTHIKSKARKSVKNLRLPKKQLERTTASETDRSNHQIIKTETPE